MLIFAAIISLVAAYSGYIEPYAYNNQSILVAVFDENTTYIGEHAFCNTTLEIAYFTGTMTKIHQHAFDNNSIIIRVRCPDYIGLSVTNASCTVADVYARLSKCVVSSYHDDDDGVC